MYIICHCYLSLLKGELPLIFIDNREGYSISSTCSCHISAKVLFISGELKIKSGNSPVKAVIQIYLLHFKFDGFFSNTTESTPNFIYCLLSKYINSNLIAPMQSKSQLIKTYARIKPRFLGEEKMFFRKNVCTVQSVNNQLFQFDGVFDDDSVNQQVYKETTYNTIQQCFQGYNGCILAYGQTASGKTHTIKGTFEDPGIVPQALQQIFSKEKNQQFSFNVKVQYIEIYNEDIIDLLALGQNKIVQIREDGKGNLVFLGITQKLISSLQEGMELYQMGQKKRKFASNNVNSMSSRSHVIFRIDLTIAKDLQRRFSQINLVDLAGSQGVDQTKASKILKSEGENINKSLLALKKVLKEISESQGRNYVNYRDSKLTRILKKSLCENATSSIICTINPTQQNYHESINTLKFGLTAGKIKIQSRQNMIKSQQTTLKAQQQIFKQRFADIPTRAELQQRKQQLLRLQQQFEKLASQRQSLQRQNYFKQNKINDLESYVRQLQIELDKQKNYNENQRRSGDVKINTLQTNMSYLKMQIQELDVQNVKLRGKNKELEQRQRNLLEEKQQINRQLRSVNSQINKLKEDINEQTNRSKKLTFSFRQPQEKQSKNANRASANHFQNPNRLVKNNPFYIAPYIPPEKRNKDTISHLSLSKVTQLKTKVVELGIEMKRLTKQMVELLQQNCQLKDILRQKQQWQEEEQHKKSSGKINPAAIQFNEIRRLKNKIKRLQSELKRCQKREALARNKLKKINQDQLIEVEEFGQYFHRKHNQQFYVEKEIQAFYSQRKNEHQQIDSIEIEQTRPQFIVYASLNDNPTQDNQSGQKQQQSLENSNIFSNVNYSQKKNNLNPVFNPEKSPRNSFTQGLFTNQNQNLLNQVNNQNKDFNILNNQGNSNYKNNSSSSKNNQNAFYGEQNLYNSINMKKQFNPYNSPTKSQRNSIFLKQDENDMNCGIGSKFSKKMQSYQDEILLSSIKQPKKNEENQAGKDQHNGQKQSFQFKRNVKGEQLQIDPWKGIISTSLIYSFQREQSEYQRENYGKNK